MNNQTVLEVTNLKTHFSVGNAIVKAVDGVSFNLNAGEITAIVGESGSGKSVTSLSIMRLLPSNVVDEEQGMIKYGVNTERKDLSTLEWLQHLQEELMDAAVYIEKLKSEMEDLVGIEWRKDR